MKRRFQERELEAGTIDTLNEPIATVEVSADDLANSVFGRKPQALQSEDDVLTGAQWGTLMHEAMQWLPLVTYTQASLTKELDALVANGTFTEEERNLLSDTSLYKFFSSDLGKRLINANVSNESCRLACSLKENAYTTP